MNADLWRCMHGISIKIIGQHVHLQFSWQIWRHAQDYKWKRYMPPFSLAVSQQGIFKKVEPSWCPLRCNKMWDVSWALALGDKTHVGCPGRFPIGRSVTHWRSKDSFFMAFLWHQAAKHFGRAGCGTLAVFMFPATHWSVGFDTLVALVVLTQQQQPDHLNWSSRPVIFDLHTVHLFEDNSSFQSKS